MKRQRETQADCYRRLRQVNEDQVKPIRLRQQVRSETKDHKTKEEIQTRRSHHPVPHWEGGTQKFDSQS